MACTTYRLLLAILFSATCLSCAARYQPDAELEALIAQKLLLDIRYFCPALPKDTHCTNAVTTLPPALGTMISETGIGGVILFAENLQDTRQILGLNRALQQAAHSGGHPALFIATDQEGGRVVRLPQHIATSFSGNMAIGATYARHGLKFASLSGAVIGKELAALDFNLNFAPAVDVNINPHNPVINVRSFGEDPQIVAELGLAQLQGMQQQGIIAALKHFPGHGDTSVDSHTGLPRVDHSAETIRATDLKPFQYAIDSGQPGMIMTAHIQYPALDNTEFTAKDGQKIILPATMSRTILTDILRKEMGFQGVIITDALDMAGITPFFAPAEAVIKTFSAGSDIALMPITLRSPADVPAVKTLIQDVAKAVQNGRLALNEMQHSLQRIQQLKKQYIFPLKPQQPTNMNLEIGQAMQILGATAHRQGEQQLANNAIVLIKNQQVVPIATTVNTVHLVMPDTTKCLAMTYALKASLPRLALSCSSLAGSVPLQAKAMIEEADLVLFADITPQQSLAELGDMDDMEQQRSAPKVQSASLLSLMRFSKQQHKTALFISMRSPYNIPHYAPYADGILATFAYNLQEVQYRDDSGRLGTQYTGAIYQALAEILAGTQQARGTLPVSIGR
jgi:beta-N-acetylhexosaminidase